MISTDLARALCTAGLRWQPQPGDRFGIEGAETGDVVYTVSDMTVEVHEYPSGKILGFNGTTEWALDSVDLAQTLWLPREDQLRDLLRDGFDALLRGEEGGETSYLVRARILGEPREFRAPTPDDAYGEAVLELILRSLGPGPLE